MYICDEKTFEKLVKRTPELCAWGMGSESLCRFDSVFFRANRLLLLNSYREFVICCTWLREQCAAVKTVSAKSPTSRLLQQMAKTPHYVGHGAMIAAILYMGFPYKADPHSPAIQTGVSLNSPCFRPVHEGTHRTARPDRATIQKVPLPPAAPLPVYPVKRAADRAVPGNRPYPRLPFSAGL